MINPTSLPAGNPMLLLGMHRSGTSVIARLLGEFGARIGAGDELLPAHPEDNPRGYWERLDVLTAHDRYLAAIGCAWDRVANLPEVPRGGAAETHLRAELRQAIAKLARPGSWLVKDPRLCLLLPVWQELLPAAVSIVAVRHPQEIAASLLRSHRGVYPAAFVVGLWEKYLIRALKALNGRDALFVDYRRFLSDPHTQAARLHAGLIAMGVSDLQQPAGDDVRKLVDRDLYRHHVADEQIGRMNRQQLDLMSWLETSADADGPVRIGELNWIEPDEELSEFEASFDARVQVGRESAQQQNDESMRAMLDAFRGLQDAYEQMRESHSSRLEALLVEQSRLRDDNLRREREVRSAAIDACLLRAELSRTQAHAGHLATHSAALEQGIAEIKASWSWRFSAPVRALARFRLFPGRSEQWLYRLYYRLPGLNSSRKRALIGWLHERLPWLTRNTVSYQLYQASKRISGSAESGNWLRQLEPVEAERVLGSLSKRPLISILMPVFNTDPSWLAAAVDSVRSQRYPDWQLCIADDASDRQDTMDWLAQLDDPRIKLVRMEDNVGIALASNAALAAADGDYVALLDHDDVLPVDALLEAARGLDLTDADFLYTDEDKIDFDGGHVEPHFKPDFSPDYFHSSNYLCHLSVIRKSIVEAAGGFRRGFDGAQDYDLFLRCSELARTIVHLPKVLYHWRKHAGSTSAASEAKPKSWDAGKRALEQSLERRGVDGSVELGGFPNTYRVRYPVQGEPLVSVIVPFRDQPELLKACVTSVLGKGGYRNIELIAVDNGSVEQQTRELLEHLQKQDERFTVLRHDVPFNYSAINNWAARQARGEFLLLLNNDIEAISQDWIRTMLEHAQRPEIGVVGARLLYPDDTVQHAGVIIGLGGVAGHSHLFQSKHHPGYFARAHLTQNVSAVTFACAMMRAQLFAELEGLNESDLEIAFNDVDFCLRAREKGYLVVYTPYAELYHHESKSRGAENTPEKLKRFNREIHYMQQRHRKILTAGDPYYNPNLSLHAHRSFEIEVRSC